MNHDTDAWGVMDGYEDASGRWVETPEATRRMLISAMGAEPSDPPPEGGPRIIRQGDTVAVPGGAEVQLEGGGTQPCHGSLPPDLPPGYHELHAGGTAERLIVSPGRAHLPDGLRTWGLAAQVYACRSQESWGMGDLADLARLGGWVNRRGAGVLLTSPVAAVSPVEPRETSPYYPTSRRFLDPAYLRIEHVPGAAGVDLDDLAAAGRALNRDRSIDRDEVARLKTRALERIWQARPGVRDDPHLRQYRDERGEELTAFATFCALAERHGSGWQSWPDHHRRPDGAGVAEFRDAHAERVAFHAWVQWCCDRQLAAAGDAVPLMRDLPVGFDPGGADAWAWQDLLADGVTVGAPPDALGPAGQDWGLPAFVPWKLRAAGYEPVVQTLQAAFRHATALRIDHVMGLFRLFWVPAGGSPRDGGYVRYPAGDLLDILALESQRAGSYVVGEDLGTVEPGVRDAMLEHALLRYQVLWFEDQTPGWWAQQAMASVSTHDLPTVTGLWTGADEQALEELGLAVDRDWFAAQRRRLVEWAGVAADAPAGEVVLAVHRLLGTARCAVVVAQLEDALAVAERPNVPGTTRTVRPNWSLALPATLEEFERHAGVDAVLEALADGRR